MRNVLSLILQLILGVFLSLTIRLGLVLTLASCSVVKPVPVETVVKYEIRDSVNYVDSTVYHHLYKEIYKDYTGLLDTLNLETSYSTAKAWTDTTNMLLKGEIKNKDVDMPVQIKWKEKIAYRDSLVTKEVPIPVTVEKKYVPKFYKWLLVFNGLLLLVFIVHIMKKFKIFSIFS